MTKTKMNPDIWRYIFDAIEDPAFLHDAQYRLTLVNRAYCRAAGMTEVQALGKPYWEVFPPGTGPLPGCKHAEIGKGNTNSEEDVSVGAKLYLSKGYTVRDPQGQYLYSLHLLSDITAARQAATALAASEESLRLGVETARDAIITVDGDSGTVSAWNPAAEAMFGYSRQQAIGRVLHDFLPPPRFRETATQALAHFAASGQGAAIDKAVELVALHQDGTEFPIELSLTATQLHGQWQATGIARDISERKAADNQLRLFRELIDCSNDGFFVLDPVNGRILDVNEATCRSLGYTRDELLQLNVVAIQTSLPDVAAWQVYLQSLRDQNVSLIEVEQLRKDGSRFPTEINFGYASAMGRDYIVAAARDISERKQKDAELQMTVNRLSAAQHIGKLGFLDWDLLTNEIELSDETLRIYGLTPGANKLKFKEITKLVHPDDVEDAVKSLRNAIETGAKHDIEHRIIRADGTVIYVHTPAQVIRDTNGKPIRIVGTVQDITESKQAESRLAEQLAELRQWHDATLGRETRILDLKHEVNELLGKSGLPARYPSAESQD